MIAYENPLRVATPDSARGELRRLERSLRHAVDHDAPKTVDYLDRRIGRALRALRLALLAEGEDAEQALPPAVADADGLDPAGSGWTDQEALQTTGGRPRGSRGTSRGRGAP